MTGACIACTTPERIVYHGEFACPQVTHDPKILPISALPEPPAPPEVCCCNAESRGRLCAYHQGFEDGWEALRATIEGTP